MASDGAGKGRRDFTNLQLKVEILKQEQQELHRQFKSQIMRPFNSRLVARRKTLWVDGVRSEDLQLCEEGVAVVDAMKHLKRHEARVGFVGLVADWQNANTSERMVLLRRQAPPLLKYHAISQPMLHTTAWLLRVTMRVIFRRRS